MTSNEPFRVVCVVGARPNFMKIAPLMRVFRAEPSLSASLVHTGQHYDEAMKASFFEQLDIPMPDVDLEVGSGSHAVQTAEIMRRFEPVLDSSKFDAVLVVGDVNSTIACALVAAKKGVPVIHVEAGLRSYDRDMPEEINRVLTDQISDLLLTTERDAAKNLVREGVDPSRIRFVGNLMIDTLRHNLARSVEPAEVISALPGGQTLSLEGGYGLLTLHRPSNVDDERVLRRVLESVSEIARRFPIVFPVHPRTAGRLEASGLREILGENVLLAPPLRYLEMIGLMSSARVVLTDSGGIQEETTALGVPCITLRENTERPITVSSGTNTVVGTHPAKIRAVFAEAVANGGKRGQIPEFWDGHAAERILEVILAWARERKTNGGAPAGTR
jgi:UDP-N-acetylglucosamine 2-epimerase (non-hydrolysing)